MWSPTSKKQLFVHLLWRQLRAQYQRSESVQPGAISPYVLLSMESHSRTIFLPQWHVSGFGQYNVFLDHIHWLATFLVLQFCLPSMFGPQWKNQFRWLKHVAASNVAAYINGHFNAYITKKETDLWFLSGFILTLGMFSSYMTNAWFFCDMGGPITNPTTDSQ